MKMKKNISWRYMKKENGRRTWQYLYTYIPFHMMLQYLERRKASQLFFLIFRSSRSQMFFKTGFPKNFMIFTRKHPRWNLFLIKLQAFRAATLLKRDSNTGVFLWILRNFINILFIEHLRWWLRWRRMYEVTIF